MESRIKRLESLVPPTPPPRVNLIESVVLEHTAKAKEREKNTSLAHIQDEFESRAKKIGVKMKNFSKICEMAVDFLDENAGDIARLVGYALTGQIKYDIACKLVGNLFSDIAFELIGQTIESQHTIVINRREKELHKVDIEDKYIVYPKREVVDGQKGAKKKAHCIPWVPSPHAGKVKSQE